MFFKSQTKLVFLSGMKSFPKKWEETSIIFINRKQKNKMVIKHDSNHFTHLLKHGSFNGQEIQVKDVHSESKLLPHQTVVQHFW